MKTITILTVVGIFLCNIAINAQDSLNIHKVGEASGFWSQGYDVAIHNDLGFYATYATGIRLIDLSDPEHPAEVGNILPGTKIFDFAFSGDIIYCVGRGTGVVAVDISDFEHPRRRGSYSAEGRYWEYAAAIEISGNIAYVAYGEAGLKVFDISDPDNLQEIGSLVVGSQVTDVFVNGDILYLRYGTYMRIVDVSNPREPRVLGLYEGNLIYEMTFQGDFIYTALTDELSIIDVSDAANPVQVGEFTDDYVFGIYAAGERVYVTTQQGFYILDVSDPSSPAQLGRCVHNRGHDITIQGDLAFVSSVSQGVFTVDISNEAEPRILGNLRRPEAAIDVGLFGSYAMLRDPESGFWIYDIVDPTSPAQADAREVEGLYQGEFLIRGNQAYVVTQDYLKFVDLSNPDTLRVTLTVDLGGTGLAYNSDHLGVVRYRQIFYYDLTVPNRPIAVGSYNGHDEITALAMTETHAYLTTSNATLYIVDISDPNSLRDVGSLFIFGEVNDIKWQDGYLYIANGEYGVRIVDVSDPTNPLPVTMFDTPGKASEVEILGDRAIVADGPGGVRVLDISRPSHPREFGYYDTPGYAVNLEIGTDSLIYVADSTNIGVYNIAGALRNATPDIELPHFFQISNPFPNPFNSSTHLSLGLPNASPVKVRVFDVTGNIVTAIFSGELKAGEHSLDWNADGFPAGVYLISIEANGLASTRKVLLMK